MQETDLELLIRVAEAAGGLALTFTGPKAKVWDKPDQAGPVTEADLAVDALLQEQLRAARPDYGWLSEETEDSTERLSRDTVFIVDPIDGTRSFIEGSRTWAHSLAVVHKGEAKAGVVFLPQRELMYVAAQGQGSRLNGNELSVGERRDLTEASLLAAKPNLNAKFWGSGEAPKVNRSFRPSLAYRLALVAEGRFDAMMTLRPAWEWDIAAGDVILREAGAIVSNQKGAALRFNNRVPKLAGVVAANEALHAELITRLAPGATI